MTTFEDGPAKGQHLRLQRAPQFLRVTVDGGGKWDALDALNDEPRPDEVMYAYELADKPSWCHVRASKGQSGFFSLATYRLVAQQPSDAEMRTRAAWVTWCELQPARSDL